MNEHLKTMFESVDGTEKVNVLLVGQVYLDTILSIDGFPEEDAKKRASDSELRTGGNSCNTAEVLSQFNDNIQVFYMSAVGSKETSSFVTDQLEQKGINIEPFLYRADATIPASYIVHNTQNGSRTIISHNDILDIQYDEFCETFKKLKDNDAKSKWWVHFEGRNIDEALRQIDWLEDTANHGNWRSDLVISVELEKPERENIEELVPRGDILFFSKVFAQKKGFDDPMLFLDYYREKTKQKALIFCTWGSSGAYVLDDKKHHAKAPSIEHVVDSVGAGDTFNAGIILALCHQLKTEKALEFACTLATLKVAQQGFDGLKDKVHSHFLYK